MTNHESLWKKAKGNLQRWLLPLVVGMDVSPRLTHLDDRLVFILTFFEVCFALFLWLELEEVKKQDG